MQNNYYVLKSSTIFKLVILFLCFIFYSTVSEKSRNKTARCPDESRLQDLLAVEKRRRKRQIRKFSFIIRFRPYVLHTIHNKHLILEFFTTITNFLNYIRMN